MAVQNSLNLNSNGVVTFNNTTGVFTGSSITQHDVLIGGSANAIANVAPSATSGVALVSTGATSDPSFGTVVVAGGGTGLATLVAYQLLAGGTTTTGNVQQISNGSAGQVLTSNGGSALATFQAFTSQSAYLNVTGATQAMAVNTGYVTNDAGALVTYTFPATFAVGSIFAIAGNSSNGWTVDLTTNTITANVGNTVGTTAVASTNRYDCIKFVASVANTTVTCLGGFGNWTVT